MPLDYTQARDQVRLLIPDTEELFFNAAQLDAFLAIEGGVVKLAAARAVEALARDHALVLKVMEVNGVRTDGAAVSRELRQHAKALREEVEADGSFAIAEQVYSPGGWEAALWQDRLRSGL